MRFPRAGGGNFPEYYCSREITKEKSARAFRFCLAARSAHSHAVLAAASVALDMCTRYRTAYIALEALCRPAACFTFCHNYTPQ